MNVEFKCQESQAKQKKAAVTQVKKVAIPTCYCKRPWFVGIWEAKEQNLLRS